MRQGLRWQLIFRTLSVPFVIFALIVTIPAALDSWPIAPVPWLPVTIPASVIALYFTWTLTAGDRLRQLNERRLFNGASVKDLTVPLKVKKVPELLINATSLTEGRPVVFTPVGRMGPHSHRCCRDLWGPPARPSSGA